MHKVALLVFSLISVAFAAVATAAQLPDKPHIYVEGSAEVKVAPDQMTIIVGLEATNPELAVAKKDVDERSRRLIQAIKDLDIAPEDMSTTALHINPAFDYRNGERVSLGTRVHRQVDITLRDLTKYSRLMAALVDAEISNTVSTELKVSNDSALTDRAQLAALEDARQRAEGIAKSLGNKLGPAYSVSEFDLREDRHQLFTPRNMKAEAGVMMAADRASSEPFEPGLIVANAQVYVVFLIK
mgnify:FL=1